MTTRLALVLAAFVIGLCALDLMVGGGWTLFLLKRVVDLVDWLTFWR
jgi:hypothetical protein